MYTLTKSSFTLLWFLPVLRIRDLGFGAFWPLDSGTQKRFFRIPYRYPKPSQTHIFESFCDLDFCWRAVRVTSTSTTSRYYKILLFASIFTYFFPRHSVIFLYIGSGFRIRIRIGSLFNQVSGSGSGSLFGIWIGINGGKNDPQKLKKKKKNFMFWSAGCSLLRAEGFFCNLDVLYEGTGIGKLWIWCLNFWSSKPWIRIGIQPKMLDPDPSEIKTDPKPYFGCRFLKFWLYLGTWWGVCDGQTAQARHPVQHPGIY